MLKKEEIKNVLEKHLHEERLLYAHWIVEETKAFINHDDEKEKENHMCAFAARVEIGLLEQLIRELKLNENES